MAPSASAARRARRRSTDDVSGGIVTCGWMSSVGCARSCAGVMLRLYCGCIGCGLGVGAWPVKAVARETTSSIDVELTIASAKEGC